jgi:hypothetical protein
LKTAVENSHVSESGARRRVRGDKTIGSQNGQAASRRVRMAIVENRAMAAKVSRDKVTGRASDRSYRESERIGAYKKWTGAVPGVQLRKWQMVRKRPEMLSDQGGASWRETVNTMV